MYILDRYFTIQFIIVFDTKHARYTLIQKRTFLPQAPDQTKTVNLLSGYHVWTTPCNANFACFCFQPLQNGTVRTITR